MGLTFQSVTAQNANELDSAVGTAAKSGSSALFVMTDALFNTHLARIAQASIKTSCHRFTTAPDLSKRAG